MKLCVQCTISTLLENKLQCKYCPSKFVWLNQQNGMCMSLANLCTSMAFKNLLPYRILEFFMAQKFYLS